MSYRLVTSMIVLSPESNPVIESQEHHDERIHKRKAMGLMPLVRCQDTLANLSGNGIKGIPPVLPEMQA